MPRTPPGGPPPEDSPYRCQAKRRCGEQCKRWALKESSYCQFHGGRGNSRTRTDHLPAFYAKRLTKTLQAAIEEQLEQAPHEQLQLFEELALMRVYARDAVILYNAAVDKGSEELRLSAGALMAQVLGDVAKMCQSASNVSLAGKDKVSIHNIEYVVGQIVRILYQTLDDEDAQRVEERIRSDLKVYDQTGTTITPDQDVLAMDATVPNA